MAHTPGPWNADYSYDGGTTVALMRTRRSVISVNAAKEWIHDEHGRVKSSATLEAESEANAKLMAASPDLLDTAREFVALYEGTVDLLGDSVKAKLARARAAIAKAEGR